MTSELPKPIAKSPNRHSPSETDGGLEGEPPDLVKWVLWLKGNFRRHPVWAVFTIVVVAIVGATEFGPNVISVLRQKKAGTETSNWVVERQLRPVYFKANSTQLTDESVERLHDYAKILSGREFKHLIIESHTKAFEPSFNRSLGRVRNASVARVLEESGIPKEKIITVDLGGEEASSAPNPAYAGFAAFRVEWP